jgi:hypothetical protein
MVESSQPAALGNGIGWFQKLFSTLSATAISPDPGS